MAHLHTHTHALSNLNEFGTTNQRYKFKDGKLVRQTEGRFNGVWTDRALEKNYNRDAKTKLFTGISQ